MNKQTPISVNQTSHLPVWMTYGIAVVMAASFSVILFMLAWNEALESKTTEFAFESVTVHENVIRSLSASDDVAKNLSILFDVMSEVDEDAFMTFSSSVILRYPFIESISYHPLDRLVSNRTPEEPQLSFPLLYQRSRTEQDGLPALFDLYGRSDFRHVVNTAIETGVALPSPGLGDERRDSRYLLLRPIFKNVHLANHESPKQVKGMIAIKINPAYLFGKTSRHRSMYVKLLSESESISGRQVLFEKVPDEAYLSNMRVIKEMNQEDQIQFPYYSMKLSLSKAVHWENIDRGVIFTALFLGVGVSLLLIALARAKELQARDLLERNEVIERQVEDQTRELAVARDQALEASRVKSEFLASMSHEIRTPLNAIIGMAELLSETTMTRDQEKYVSVFRRAGEALLSLVNDILDLSKIEADQLVLEEINFNIRELAEQSVEIYALKTDAKGLELACQIDQDVPEVLIGDPSRLRQIILNLIGNAIKFTDHGEIVLRIKRDQEKPIDGQLVISVQDSGIGIPADKLKSIFASFTQVDSSTTRKYGGTGLGLTISRKLVDMMGGQIWVDSEQGKGSCFSFTARFGVARQSVRNSALPKVELKGKRVLIVDDNETNRLILRQILKNHQAQVTEAEDGEKALECFNQALAKKQGYDLILMDCRMPGMDGFEVAEQIKQQGGDVSTVMMLTSSNLGVHLTRSRELGMAAYLVKPVKQVELLKSINEALASRLPAQNVELSDAAPGPGSGADSSVETPKHILLVEDTPDNRLLINAYLKSTPHTVDEAEDGAVAVEKFKQNQYDLVLMDVQMPVMDGHAATRAIRQWETEQGRVATPIIALTAHAIKEDMEKSIAAGCNSHLTKPIKKQVLIQAIQEHTA